MRVGPVSDVETDRPNASVAAHETVESAAVTGGGIHALGTALEERVDQRPSDAAIRARYERYRILDLHVLSVG